MKITFSPNKSSATPNAKTMLAVGAGIAALATYVASNKVHRDKLKSIVTNVKDKWNDFVEKTEAEIEFDADAAKKMAKKVIRKSKAKVAQVKSDISQKA